MLQQSLIPDFTTSHLIWDVTAVPDTAGAVQCVRLVERAIGEIVWETYASRTKVDVAYLNGIGQIFRDNGFSVEEFIYA